MPASKKKRSKAGRASAGGRPPATAATQPSTRSRSWLPPWLEPLLLRIPYFARRRAPQISRAAALAAIPFRNELIEWETREPSATASGEADEEPAVVVLRIPRRQDRWGRVLNRFFEGPTHKEVILDELGTDVWQLCDGLASVDDVVRALVKKHKLERREVELSLTTYLQTLAKRGFIGLRMERE